VDFSDHALEEAKLALDGFYDLFKRLEEPSVQKESDAQVVGIIDRTRELFCQAMDNDLNTAQALAVLQKLRGDVNKLVEQGLSTQKRRESLTAIVEIGQVVRLFGVDRWQFKRGPSRPTGLTVVITQLTDDQIADKVAERNEARKQKDFKKADEIRQLLAADGIIIEDKPDGTSRWKR